MGFFLYVSITLSAALAADGGAAGGEYKQKILKRMLQDFLRCGRDSNPRPHA